VTEDVHAERRERAAARLRETGADGLVCFPSRNLQYLTGFAEEPGERHLLLVVPAADRSSDTPDGGDQTAAEPTLLVPARLVPGPNGAKPHHGCGDREIRAGEPVVLDFGTRVDGYPSDQTRTLVFDGEPPAEYERVHETVRAAQAAAVEAVEPGVAAEAIDRAARDVIEDAGYGDAFFHRTGHGVGLDVHEEPYIVAGNDRTLEPGMVFSVEPGIYLDGRFGCRIEDLVVVTEDGCERLNDTDRGWR
jgi:Xaa-Pro aminopeptidase